LEEAVDLSSDRLLMNEYEKALKFELVLSGFTVIK
jgi:hypothetical protein